MKVNERAMRRRRAAKPIRKHYEVALIASRSSSMNNLGLIHGRISTAC
jgi:hypothetical protein